MPDDYVIQPFLFPTDEDPELGAIRAAVAAGRVAQFSEISVQLLYSREGELLGRFASRNRLKGGVPVEIVPIETPEVWSAVDEIASVLADYAPRGPINLQGRITPTGLMFFEMNPRFTGITGNRSQFGFNEVALLVDNFVSGVKRKLKDQSQQSRRQAGGVPLLARAPVSVRANCCNKQHAAGTCCTRCNQLARAPLCRQSCSSGPSTFRDLPPAVCCHRRCAVFGHAQCHRA